MYRNERERVVCRIRRNSEIPLTKNGNGGKNFLVLQNLDTLSSIQNKLVIGILEYLEIYSTDYVFY